MSARELYDLDFYEWTRCNASLLRARRFDHVDVDHLAEELEDMGKRERRELQSRLEVLLTHLLKWTVQTGRRSPSWEATITVQRSKIRKLLGEMPSLRSILAESIPELYENAALSATAETRLGKESFPNHCPFSLEQLLDPDFFPE